MNLGDIETELNNLPEKIRQQQLKVIEAERVVENAKLGYDVEFGMALVASTRPNATEKKAEAQVNSKEKAQGLLETKYNLQKEEAAFNFLNNRFTALRKIGSLEQEMLRSQLGGQ